MVQLWGVTLGGNIQVSRRGVTLYGHDEVHHGQAFNE